MQEKNRAILFDLDGTLINSGVTFHKIVNELKSACGEKEISFEVVREFSSRGASLILKNSFPDRSEEEIYELKEKFLNRYESILTNEIVVYGGVEELLKYLDKHDIPWGIITNKSQNFTYPIVQKLGWDKKTDIILCPEDLEKTKPDPEGVNKAIKMAGVEKRDSMYVGDHERDILTAKNAGVLSVACTYGYYESDPNKWSADFIIDTPLGLKKFL